MKLNTKKLPLRRAGSLPAAAARKGTFIVYQLTFLLMRATSSRSCLFGFADAHRNYEDLFQLVNYKPISLEEFLINVDDDKFHDHITKCRTLFPSRLQP